MSTTDIRGIKRSSGATQANARAEIVANEKAELLVAQGLPSYAEMTRKGQGWSVMAVAAVAALVVRPAAAAAFELWNGYAAGGPSLIIDRIFTHQLVRSTTALGGGSIMYAQVTAAKAAPTQAAIVTRGNSGKAYGGSVISAVGTSVIDSGWFPWGPHLKNESAGSVVPAGGLTVEVGGRLIVPPQCALCLHVVSGYTGDTFTSGASWFEETITNEP